MYFLFISLIFLIVYGFFIFRTGRDLNVLEEIEESLFSFWFPTFRICIYFIFFLGDDLGLIELFILIVPAEIAQLLFYCRKKYIINH